MGNGQLHEKIIVSSCQEKPKPDDRLQVWKKLLEKLRCFMLNKT
jgi:hypothetical protein